MACTKREQTISQITSLQHTGGILKTLSPRSNGEKLEPSEIGARPPPQHIRDLRYLLHLHINNYEKEKDDDKII